MFHYQKRPNRFFSAMQKSLLIRNLAMSLRDSFRPMRRMIQDRIISMISPPFS